MGGIARLLLIGLGIGAVGYKAGEGIGDGAKIGLAVAGAGLAFYIVTRGGK